MSKRPKHEPSRKNDEDEDLEGVDVLVTGLTEDDFRDTLQLKQAGYKAPPQCYLCKRQKGVQAISVVYDDGVNEPRFAQPAITLYTITRRVHGVTYGFRLCQECAILLGFFSDVE